MVPNANARHFLLKAKQRDLIAAVGGIERAAAICSFGKSTVGRWANAESPELMPLEAVFALEEECCRFDMSEAIAGARGRRFAETEVSASDNVSVMASHAEAVVQMGELMTAGALAFADGKLTPAEANQIDKALASVERSLADYRKVVASVRGHGGLSIIGGAA
ncbi:hypothetical protein ASD64_09085 [Mesorhizobium sp. Root157]|uniref:phage regulatory CII family protein n=1 Tax=Mesorhizobium sp. Root157 TaxID=1736477 RepID=UPI0006F955DE|nr:phage regulatory CII family protein [Mesorhizobium sp. Root157]KQZ82043.1 hypothetical protein ASD64_09085 [Mesorhizobium sp. Root157]